MGEFDVSSVFVVELFVAAEKVLVHLEFDFFEMQVDRNDLISEM